MTRRPHAAYLPATLALLLGACATTGTATFEPASLTVNGPYAVRTYTDFPDVPEFGAATIYYPAATPEPVGGVAIAPGFTEEQRHIAWWGPRLASHGYAVLILDTNDPRERPDARAAALWAAVELLRAENERVGSPLRGRVAVDEMAVMGHSMGGGGALRVAAEHGDALSAAIPFTPWEPDADLSRVEVPTLVIAGSADEIAAVAEHAWHHYEAMPASTEKIYMELDGGDHFLADTNRGTELATIGRYALAWLKLHLDGDDRYRDYLYEDGPAADGGKFSRYVTNPRMGDS